MIFKLPRTLCKQASLYYYGFATGSFNNIPKKCIKHLEKCKNCKSEVHRLKEAIDQVHNQHHKNPLIIEMLGLHFKYIGENVTCDIAKPFLPTTADVFLKISTETPITAHIEKCNKCIEDIKTLESLNLDSRQLYIITQVFTLSCQKDMEICKSTEQYVDNLALLNLEKIPINSLGQLCICKNCRDKVFDIRKKLIDELNNNPECCENPLKYSDLFDFCIPLNLDTESLQYINQTKPLISHVNKCPNCLEKINSLQKTIYDILERSKSNIVTAYSFAKKT